MRCVGVTAILLLALLYVQDTTAASRAQVENICKRQYPAIKCHTLGEGWYKMNGNRCIKLFMNGQNFAGAKATCDKECGALVSMHSVKEYSEVLCLLIRSSKKQLRVWVGGERQENGKYGWTDGTEFKFTRWNPKQPDFYAKKESCMEMNIGVLGHWNDHVCSVKKAFVCATTM